MKIKKSEYNEKLVPFETVDGTSNKISVFSAKQKNLTVIICFPAMGVPGRFYRELAIEFARNGFNAITADLRGIGNSTVRASRSENFGYFEMINYDWPSVIEMAAKLFPQSAIYLLGHSLGGQISCLYSSINKGSKLKGLILITSCSVYFNGWRFPENLMVLSGIQLAFIISKIFRYFPGHLIGFGGREARSVISDWSRQNRTGKYKISNCDIDFEKSLSELELPVFAISIDRDKFAPVGALKHLLKKIGKAEIKHVHFIPGEHGLKKINHFTWAKNPAPFVKIIKDWI